MLIGDFITAAARVLSTDMLEVSAAAPGGPSLGARTRCLSSAACALAGAVLGAVQKGALGQVLWQPTCEIVGRGDTPVLQRCFIQRPKCGKCSTGISPSHLLVREQVLKTRDPAGNAELLTKRQC